jgi:hypothetical protein
MTHKLALPWYTNRMPDDACLGLQDVKLAYRYSINSSVTTQLPPPDINAFNPWGKTRKKKYWSLGYLRKLQREQDK